MSVVKVYAIAAWMIFCGFSLLVLFVFRRRSGAAKIIRMLHLGLYPEFDPRILLIWGFGAIGMAVLWLIVAALE